MSTSGERVRQFLACTYAILRSAGTFTRKVNIRVIQCDDQIRSDDVLHDLEDLSAARSKSGASSTSRMAQGKRWPS